MTLTLKLKLDMVKMPHQTKNEVIVRTERQIQAVRKYYLPEHAGGNKSQ